MVLFPSRDIGEDFYLVISEVLVRESLLSWEGILLRCVIPRIHTWCSVAMDMCSLHHNVYGHGTVFHRELEGKEREGRGGKGRGGEGRRRGGEGGGEGEGVRENMGKEKPASPIASVNSHPPPPPPQQELQLTCVHW